MIRIAPSRLHRGMACHLAMAREHTYPSTVSDAAIEGLVAHWVGEQALKTHQPVSAWIGREHRGMTVDQDMAPHVQTYVDDVRSTAETHATIEQRQEMDRDGVKMTAYLDAHWFDAASGTLYIWDLKYGHNPVEVRDNWQFIAYGVVVMNAMFRAGLESSVRTVVCRVVQPRPYHPDGKIREWSFDAALWRNYANQIWGAAASAQATETPEAATGSHCLYCRMIADCPAHRVALHRAIDVSLRAAVYELTPQELSAELTWSREALEILNQRVKILEQMGLERGCPGYEVAPGRGRTVWADGIDPVMIGQALGVDLAAPLSAITPAQARDRKILTEDQLKPFTQFKPGKRILKRADYSRIQEVLNSGN